MIQRIITFTEYWFEPKINGTDWLEGNQSLVDKALGKGVAYFHNKKGGALRMMFIGDPSTIEKANIIHTVEQVCELQFVKQQEVNYLPSFEQNLKKEFGDLLVVE